jgi:hypothetical protein
VVIVDAINKSNQLQIEFPAGHDDHQKLSRGFCHCSTAQIDCFVLAAIDRLLIIWLERPSKDDCDRTTAEGNTHEPTGLLHGGDHMEDVGRNILRQHRRAAVAGVTNTVLPQQLLHNLVVNQGLQRPPTPRQW